MISIDQEIVIRLHVFGTPHSFLLQNMVLMLINSYEHPDTIVVFSAGNDGEYG